MPITQDERILSMATPLGKDFLLVDSFVVKEAISNLFTIEVELRHEEASETGPPTEVDPVKLLGKSITIAVAQRDDTIRHFNGIVNRFTQLNRDVRFTYYRMELVPQLWLLTKISQSRIFQEKSVPDIVKEILGSIEHKFELQGTYEPRNYCVQYRESDFDFISRLMEEEGIYYFFEHTSDTHRMIIANTPSSHRDCPITSTLEFAAEITNDMWVPSVKRWDLNYELQTGKIAFWDHKFELPKKKLDVTKDSRFTVGNNKQLEFYDYPGGYARKYDGIDKGGGERAGDLQKIFQDNAKKAAVALDALDVKYHTTLGESDCSAITSGYRFKLENHPMASQNGQYVLTRVTHNGTQSPDYASESLVGNPYFNQFDCIPYGAGAPPFRPQPVTHKPVVRGSQTATVVGPAAEEIFTDKYGRVKVQFHWDRHGQYDSNSSCWVRVAQGSAGKKWGMMFIPRIGWEVVVDFLEGDPDQPIIVGSVYNAESMPPYTLPDEKTKSTIKTNSSKGGGGFNELRFEDKAGSEQIFFHAQKDQDIRVKNDCKETIEHDRHLIVKNDQYEQVKKDKYLQVTGNQTEKVDGNVHLKVGSNKEQKIGSKYAVDSGQEIHLKAGMSVTIEAGTSVTLKAGGNFVNIGPSGVSIKGTMVMINSGGAAGSGGGASPDTPKDPKEAEVGESGQRVDLRPESKPPPQPPNLKILAQAAQNRAANPAAPSVEQVMQQALAAVPRPPARPQVPSVPAPDIQTAIDQLKSSAAALTAEKEAMKPLFHAMQDSPFGGAALMKLLDASNAASDVMFHVMGNIDDALYHGIRRQTIAAEVGTADKVAELQQKADKAKQRVEETTAKAEAARQQIDQAMQTAQAQAQALQGVGQQAANMARAAQNYAPFVPV